jgi:hypothetical protein
LQKQELRDLGGGHALFPRQARVKTHCHSISGCDLIDCMGSMILFISQKQITLIPGILRSSAGQSVASLTRGQLPRSPICQQISEWHFGFQEFQ